MIDPEQHGHCPKCQRPRFVDTRKDLLCEYCQESARASLFKDGFGRWLAREDAKLMSHHKTQLEYMWSPKRWR